jgi:TM2 domain-containing membrane protein YozV/ribosomal protein L40E
MLTCQSCNTVNPPDAQFCIGCGAPLTAEPMRPADSVACPACNTPNPPNAQFCVKCGAPLPAAPLEPASPNFEPWPSTPNVSPSGSGWLTPGVLTPTSSAKQRAQVLILEIVPACFGVFGIGWFYSGQTTAGTLWLVGMLVWEFIGLALSVVTVGLGCMCFFPLNLALVAVSAVMLNNYINQHPDQFVG